ncbi:DUF1190 domain-containing protein [Planctomycetes bacterium Poly30]|uniref:DUF1190 domain-containing protein n=1 Tax=Saltatorellus ferox TaxID=2528018 RepID=UPI0011A3E79D
MTIELGASTTADVVLVVHQGTMMTVNISGGSISSKPTFLSVNDASGTTVTGASVQEASSAVVGPLSPGDYRIRVSGKGGGPWPPRTSPSTGGPSRRPP